MRVHGIHDERCGVRGRVAMLSQVSGGRAGVERLVAACAVFCRSLCHCGHSGANMWLLWLMPWLCACVCDIRGVISRIAFCARTCEKAGVVPLAGVCGAVVLCFGAECHHRRTAL